MTPPPVEEIREHLRRVLPAWMVPGFFVRLDRLPLTPNGKLDVPALPAPDAAAASGAPFAPPESTLHAQLIEIWEGLLEHRPIGIRDHFFDLGGHSLLATQVVARIAEALKVEIPLAGIFQARTLGGVAEIIQAVLWARPSDPLDVPDASDSADSELEEGEL